MMRFSPIAVVVVVLTVGSVIIDLIPTVRSDAIIGNGKVIIGVNNYGNLKANYVGNILGLPSTDPRNHGRIGLRNGDGSKIGQYSAGASPIFDGWSAGYHDNDFFSYFFNGCDISIGSGNYYMELNNFTGINGGSTARSTVLCGYSGNMMVTHDYKPSISPYLMQVDVTIGNIGDTNFEDVHYRRNMDLDIDPTPFYEVITHMGVETTSALVHSSNNRKCRVEVGTTCIGDEGTNNVSFHDFGPKDQGSFFQFSLGKIGVNMSRSFKIFFGLTPGEAVANSTLALVQAEVASYGQPSNSTAGLPYTFIVAFSGFQGKTIFPPLPPSSRTASPSTKPSTMPSQQPKKQQCKAARQVCTINRDCCILPRVCRRSIFGFVPQCLLCFLPL
jgi:hypothetical protein